MFVNKKALLLDMNSTFMFGEDRFDEDEDFSIYYQSIGGKLNKEAKINGVRALKIHGINILDYPRHMYRPMANKS